jgi:hypothetical protein
MSGIILGADKPLLLSCHGEKDDRAGWRSFELLEGFRQFDQSRCPGGVVDGAVEDLVPFEGRV